MRSGRIIGLLILGLAGLWSLAGKAAEPARVNRAVLGSEPKEQSSDGDEKQEPVTRFEAVTSVATRTERKASDVPASVSIVTADEIALGQASDLGEALENEAGVDLMNGPRPQGESLNIRGVAGKRILLTVDGARQNFNGGHRGRLLIEPDMLKSAEILRGPGSSLYGSGAIGGVVALTTKDGADFLEPGERFAARAKQAFESANDEYLTGGTAAARLGSLDFLADFTARDSANLRQGGGDELPHSALDTRSGLYKLSWFPGGAHELGLSLNTYDQEGKSPSLPNRNVDDTNPLLDRDNEQDYLTARYVYDNPAGLLTGGRVVTYRTDLRITEDRVDEPRFDVTEFETFGVTTNADIELAPFSQVISFGADYYENTGEATRNGDPRPQFPDAVQEVYGVFVQNELTLGRFSFLPGVRFDRYEGRSETGVAEPIEENELSLRFGAQYRATNWLSIYANFGEAFRAPDILESYVSGTHFLGNEFRPNPGLRPEKAQNKEIGFRFGFDGLLGAADRLEITASYYDNDIDDFIETIVEVEVEGPPAPPRCFEPDPPDGCVQARPSDFLDAPIEPGASAPVAEPGVPIVFIGGFTTSINLPEAEIEGGELIASYEFGPILGEVSYSRVRGENKETGEPLLDIPADSIKGRLQYQWGDARLGLRVTHAEEQNRVPDLDTSLAPFARPTDGYTLLDFYGSWQPTAGLLGGLRFDFGVDNLTDRSYRRHLALLDEAGRNARARVTYRF